MANIGELFANQSLELRRGAIVLAILSQLRQARYGYALLQALQHAGMPVDAGTLYPLLRRLEKQGVLESIWDTTDSRPRKYYRMSAMGEELYEKLQAEWRSMNETLAQMIKEESTWN